jgi:hypothetical protein
MWATGIWFRLQQGFFSCAPSRPAVGPPSVLLCSVYRYLFFLHGQYGRSGTRCRLFVSFIHWPPSTAEVNMCVLYALVVGWGRIYAFYSKYRRVAEVVCCSNVCVRHLQLGFLEVEPKTCNSAARNFKCGLWPVCCYDPYDLLRVGCCCVQVVNRQPELSPPAVDSKKVSANTVKMPSDV